MSTKEERVHQVSREPGGGPREPKQSTHRRAQVLEGTILSTEDGLRTIKCVWCGFKKGSDRVKERLFERALDAKVVGPLF